MHYDFYDDNKIVDKRKTSSDSLKRKDSNVVKTIHKRKPTEIDKPIAKKLKLTIK
jgi:hypothetical protein